MSSPQSTCIDVEPGIGQASATHQDSKEQYASQRTKLSIKSSSSHFLKPPPIQALKVKIEQVLIRPEFQQHSDIPQDIRVPLYRQLRDILASAYAEFKGNTPFPLQAKNSFKKMVDDICRQLPHEMYKTVLQTTVDKVLTPSDAHRNVPLPSMRS